MRKVSTRSALALLAIITAAACGPTSPDSAPPAQGSARNAAAGIPAEVLTAGLTATTVAASGASAPSEEGILNAIVAETEQARARACAIDLRSVQTAVDVYFADLGTYPASELALVEYGILSQESSGHDSLPDGQVIAANECTGVGPPIDIDALTDAERCTLKARSFLVAREVYRSEVGAYPATEAEMLGSFIDELSLDYDIAADRSAVAAAGSLCPEPGQL
jgi:hypothetical protein